jgi:hypothetical protein
MAARRQRLPDRSSSEINTVPMNSKFRSALMLGLLGAAAILLVLQVERLLNKLPPPDDFVEYYAAGRLNAQGHNPYDPEQLLPIEQKAGRDTDEAIMMWNPPWTLSVAMPFGLLESRVAQLLWMACGFGFIVFGADLLWRLYGAPIDQRWVAWLLAFTYLPTFFVLHAGQIGAWVFLGVVLFLYFQARGWSLLAGAATVLLAIKPHLLYLFWVALLVWGLRHDWRLLVGGLLAGALATLAPLACNPDVLQQYWNEMTQRPPAQWKSPTLGALLRMIEMELDAAQSSGTGAARFSLQFLPGLLGFGWLLWHARKEAGRTWEWRQQMPLLLLISFVTASYGAWPFDLIILFPAVIHAAANVTIKRERRLSIAAVTCWLVLNGVMLALNLSKAGSFSFIVIAPALLTAYLIIMRKANTQ